jgi:alpha-ketoglutarate-dependent taurine dioxygenase
VLDRLERGPGFVILTGVPRERYTAEEWRDVYWQLGQRLGRPAEQNVQGTLLYDVRDTGQDVRTGARFSVTSAESGFHTDNSFGADVVDYVGLLCLQDAHAGGVNQLVSVHAVHERLSARHPDVLPVLYAPFHVDRRGGVRPGESPTARFPVLQRDGEELICRYLRYWIEAGHDKAGEPLTPEQVRALDTLDAVAREEDLRVEFALEPGQILFVNNRWILHNRTAFTDHPEVERRRHLVRLWLRRAAV